MNAILSAVPRSTAEIMKNTLDHLLWAVPELDEGRRQLALRTGVEAGPGGKHPGIGTHNALLDLGAERYLEIIALDPTQDKRSSLGLLLEHRRRPELLTWCARSADLDGLTAAARDAGLQADGPVAMSRQRPDGSRLEWRVLFLGGHEHGLLVPFFIEWADARQHPSRTAPRGCRLSRFTLRHPSPGVLRGLLDVLDLDVSVELAAAPGLEAQLESPRGPLTLRGPQDCGVP